MDEYRVQLDKTTGEIRKTPLAAQQQPAANGVRSAVDINDPVALKALAMEALEEIVRTAPRNVSLVAAIRELIDRIEGRPSQTIAMSVDDKRLDRISIDKVMRLANMLDEPLIIAPMPQKLDVVD